MIKENYNLWKNTYNIFGYFLLPIIISIPFYFSIYNLTFVNSYFEAISGFTSTGFYNIW